MGRKEFEASLADGVHARLVRMAGQWEGRFRLWFEPGKLADESLQRGSIRVLLGGRVLLHEYSGHCAGEPMEGVALIAYHLDERRYESAWAESFGTGTALMFSTGVSGDPRLSMLGSYSDGQGGSRWGWRTAIEQPDDDTLDLRMYNITPEGDEALAVEVNYRRMPPEPDGA
ncbi:DUF1579 domain-containing protein [Paucibacter sp. XJ19-41]|uniref:DUF1579 domain-containing protein n=1 Tax=Paucibacter sp. XJ19-41 TaxID=2927824 RepID=UPI00234B543D|nr:DUF1579 domain-containing protein [Paucibacter sp. XJ19-41]MDC6169416.1 DUF1579 domain-containing protein [Paucibacter sp. XJ19-41]